MFKLKGRTVVNVDEARCKECLEKDSLCMDYDNDEKTDECWCPKNETCGQISQSKYINLLIFSSIFEINKKYLNRKAMKVLKNVEVAMILLDVANNRPILDGSSVFSGDQVLIDVKATVKGI